MADEIDVVEVPKVSGAPAQTGREQEAQAAQAVRDAIPTVVSVAENPEQAASAQEVALKAADRLYAGDPKAAVAAEVEDAGIHDLADRTTLSDATEEAKAA